MSRAEIDTRLRTHGRDSASVVLYEASEIRQLDGKRYDAWSGLRVRYVRDRAVAFTAAMVISN
jgi:hypothetical protein